MLGLRFVKRTVNLDDPGTYHFYFGDDAGSPGTILTFFPWPNAGPGAAGAGETTHTAFSVPLAALNFWKQRLANHGLAPVHTARFNEQVLAITDPDGMKLEIVAHADAGEGKAPRFSDVPPAHAIRGFFGVTLLERSLEGTAAMLDLLGFREIASDGSRHRFAAEGTGLGNHIDVLVDAAAAYGRTGAGTVHHVAFRATDDAAQLEWRQEIARVTSVTPVQDRDYFHSIYFHEPGGVLFEIATDPPGFTLDEPIDSLGEELRIPAWLEPQRHLLEQRLAPLTLHKAEPVQA